MSSRFSSILGRALVIAALTLYGVTAGADPYGRKGPAPPTGAKVPQPTHPSTPRVPNAHGGLGGLRDHLDLPGGLAADPVQDPDEDPDGDEDDEEGMDWTEEEDPRIAELQEDIDGLKVRIADINEDLAELIGQFLISADGQHAQALIADLETASAAQQAENTKKWHEALNAIETGDPDESRELTNEVNLDQVDREAERKAQLAAQYDAILKAEMNGTYLELFNDGTASLEQATGQLSEANGYLHDLQYGE